jgi:hypothetical protein
VTSRDDEEMLPRALAAVWSRMRSTVQVSSLPDCRRGNGGRTPEDDEGVVGVPHSLRPGDSILLERAEDAAFGLDVGRRVERDELIWRSRSCCCCRRGEERLRALALRVPRGEARQEQGWQRRHLVERQTTAVTAP